MHKISRLLLLLKFIDHPTSMDSSYLVFAALMHLITNLIFLKNLFFLLSNSTNAAFCSSVALNSN